MNKTDVLVVIMMLPVFLIMIILYLLIEPKAVLEMLRE